MRSTPGQAVLLLLLAGIPACSGRAPSPPAHVILITFDTLRADHLGCYGYERETSPRIDSFARGATLYTRAMATSSWTVPTHASLFTGRFPFQHGAHAFPLEVPRRINSHPLDSGAHTLAEALRSEGYTTGAFVANDAYLHPDWQMDQGFATYVAERMYADELNKLVFDWLATRRAGDPFFLFINYIDTHTPYNALPRPGLLSRPVDPDPRLMTQLYDAVMPGAGPVPRELAGRVIDQYDTAIANVDEQFGALVDRLRAMGLYDRTMILLTSDHGEFFGEHHLVEHSKDVYQEVIQAPFLVKNPGQSQARRVDVVTSSVDVPGLIVEELPGEMARRYRHVFPHTPGSHPVIAELYYTRPRDLFHPDWGHRFNRIRTAFFEWPYKYIHSTDRRHELYRLDLDPGEERNLVTEEPEIAARLAAALEGFRGASQAAPPDELPELTEEQRRRLESLGY